MSSNFFLYLQFFYNLSEKNLVEFSLEKRSLLHRCGDDKDQLFFFFFFLPLPPPPRFNVPESRWVKFVNFFFFFLFPLQGGSLTTHGERERERETRRGMWRRSFGFLVRQSFLRTKKGTWILLKYFGHRKCYRKLEAIIAAVFFFWGQKIEFYEWIVILCFLKQSEIVLLCFSHKCKVRKNAATSFFVCIFEGILTTMVEFCLQTQKRPRRLNLRLVRKGRDWHA